jgi:hypothetical protein
MRQFYDNKGKLHTLAIDAFTLRQVHRATGIDLIAEVTENGAKALSSPVKLCEVLAAAVFAKADKQPDEAAERQFLEALEGDSFEAATEALMLAITDFFPSRPREKLRSVQAAGKAHLERVMDRKFDEALQKITEGEKSQPGN